MEPRESGDDLEDPDPRPAPRSRLTARSILGVLTIMLSLALLGLGIKMSVKYDEVPLIHVSFAFVGFTSATTLAWQLFEFITQCARRDRRGINPGAHVTVNIMLCLACVATLGYVCFWVSQGERWKYVEVHGERTAYSPLYRIGIVLVALSAAMLLVHFMLAILACRKVRQKDDESPFRPPPVVRVRYDGVGPDGTSRPMRDYEYRVPVQYEQQGQGAIHMPPYAAVRGSRENGRPRHGDAGASPRASTNGTTSAGTLEKGGS
ncbi:hypothetical protein QBC39DRAFT_253339 [Podospora conica]|nr:hypothetical protein QBC39DRAFT_253339 [Schizothecium conicum]